METRDIAANFFAKFTKDLTIKSSDKEKKPEEKIKQEPSKQVKSFSKADVYQKEQSNKNKHESDSLHTLKENLKVIGSDTLIVFTDSIFVDSSKVVEIHNEKDTLLVNNGTAESIIVRKDKLIYFTLVKAQPEMISNVAKDSLSSEISSKPRDEEKIDYTVEFWESPINYKGYKMANRKLILFGLTEPYDNIAVLYSDKKVFFQHNNIKYLIENSYTFKPLERVGEKDKTVSTLMNK